MTGMTRHRTLERRLSTVYLIYIHQETKRGITRKGEKKPNQKRHSKLKKRGRVKKGRTASTHPPSQS
jgi:hypothetical protein